ncbi:MAG: hypothetical protein QMC78_04610 [Methanocellales archaeon]|nr:hypothetical protein [Methanocellales archaeon]
MQAMLNSEEGVSPVVGMLLILTIIILSITVICVGGLPLINAARESAHLQGMRNVFNVLHADIEEVVRGPVTGVGPARITRMNIGGGALSVDSNPIIGRFTVNNGTSVLDVNPGTITYEYAEQTIAYENGATFSQYQSGSVMDCTPLIYTQKADGDNITVMIHVINIIGTDSSVGGEGFARVLTNHTEFNPMVSTTVPNANYVNITIQSEYYDAWSDYFIRELERIDKYDDLNMVTEDSNTKTVTVTIRNTGPGITDIYLCVYETRISAQVE